MNDITRMLNKILEESSQKLDEADAFGIMNTPTVFSQSDVKVESGKDEKKEELKEDEDIRLSFNEFKTLQLAYIAERMINESIEPTENLEKTGLLVEGKLTGKALEYLKKYMPTIFSS